MRCKNLRSLTTNKHQPQIMLRTSFCVKIKLYLRLKFNVKFGRCLFENRYGQVTDNAQ